MAWADGGRGIQPIIPLAPSRGARREALGSPLVSHDRCFENWGRINAVIHPLW